MRPILMSGDFDPFQVAIIVIFVIAGFIKWVWENWQASQVGKHTAPQIDPEEQRLREEAWRKQTGQSAPPPIPQRHASASPSGSSTWDELRKAWAELKEAARQAQAPAQPPPVPQRSPRRGTVRAALAAPLTPPADVPKRSVLQPSQPAVPLTAPETAAPKAAAGSFLGTLQHLRKDPALMRQAILMQEILGPPKALQTSADPAI